MSNTRVINLQFHISRDASKVIFCEILQDTELQEDFTQSDLNNCKWFIKNNRIRNHKIQSAEPSESDAYADILTLPITIDLIEDEKKGLEKYIHEQLHQQYSNTPPYYNVQKNLRSILATQGIFTSHYFENNKDTAIQVEAKKLLDKVKYLTEHGFQEIYFTYFTNEDEGNEIEIAYRQGERITDAIHANTAQAHLLAEVEKLLATDEEYRYLSTFYILPIKTHKHHGKEPIAENVFKSGIESIKQKLEQGHAVFSLTNSIDKVDQESLTPALKALTEENFSDFQKKFPLPTNIKLQEYHALKASQPSYKADEESDDDTLNLKDFYNDDVEEIYSSYPYVSDKRNENPVVKPPSTNSYGNKDSSPYESSSDDDSESFTVINPDISPEQAKVIIIDSLLSILEDNRQLKTWPLNFQDQADIFDKKDKEKIFKAITIAQKKEFLVEKIKNLMGPEKIPDRINYHTSKMIGHIAISSELTQIKDKYIKKLKRYLSAHKISNQTSDNLIAEVNQIKLADIIFNSLSDINNAVEFFEIIDSADSYAKQLRGTHSPLQRILNDIVWETNLFRKQLMTPTLDAKEKVIVNNESNVDEFKTYLLDEFNKTYYHQNSDAEITLAHSKKITVERIKKIDATDLSTFRLILLSELKGQKSLASSQDFVYKTLKNTLAKIDSQVPPLIHSRLREFTISHASKLLEYVNQRERSWSYKLSWLPGSDYAKTETTKHVQEAGKLAHQLLNAKTQEELSSIILQASQYKKQLRNNSKSKGSDLIKVIDNLEKRFKHNFKYNPLSNPKNIDEVWQKEFGRPIYMNHKIEKQLQVYKNEVENPNIDVVMSDNTIHAMQNYFNKIKEELSKDPMNDSGFMSKSFHGVIFEYLAENGKDIHDLQFTDMIKLLFKTASPTVPVNPSLSWSPEEMVFMGNIPKKVQQVTIYPSKSTCDLYCIDGNISITDYEVYKGNTHYQFHKKDYKAMMIERILPCLIDANANNGNGFILTTPILGLLDAEMIKNNADKENEIKSAFPTILREIIQENQHRLRNLKGVIITGVENPIAEIDLKGIRVIETSQEKLHPVEMNVDFKEPYAAVTFANEDRFAYPGSTLYSDDTSKNKNAINTRTDLATKITRSTGVYDNNQNIYLPSIDLKNHLSTTDFDKAKKEEGTWHAKIFGNKISLNRDMSNKNIPTIKVTLNIGNIIADLATPKSALQKRAYQLLTDPMDETTRRVCMCALTDAFTSSELQENKQLGLRLKEKIGPDYIEKMREEHPTIYYAQLCLAQLKERESAELKNMPRLGMKGKVIYLLNDFINSKDNHDLSELHGKLKTICTEIDQMPTSYYNRFFGNTKNLKLKHFLEKFNHSLEKNHLSLRYERPHKIDFSNRKF